MSKYLHAVIMQDKPTTSASPEQQHSLTNVSSIYTHRQNQLNDMKYRYLRSIKYENHLELPSCTGRLGLPSVSLRRREQAWGTYGY